MSESILHCLRYGQHWNPTLEFCPYGKAVDHTRSHSHRPMRMVSMFRSRHTHTHSTDVHQSHQHNHSCAETHSPIVELPRHWNMGSWLATARVAHYLLLREIDQTTTVLGWSRMYGSETWFVDMKMDWALL